MVGKIIKFHTFMDKIVINHLGYTIEVLDRKKAKGKEFDLLQHCVAITHKGKHKSTIYIKTPIKRNYIPVIAHELMHVIQNICVDRDIDMIQEQEQVAYIMQYALGKIMGYDYNI